MGSICGCQCALKRAQEHRLHKFVRAHDALKHQLGLAPEVAQRVAQELEKLKPTEQGLPLELAQNILGESYSSFVTSNGVDTVNFNPAPRQTVQAGFRVEI